MTAFTILRALPHVRRAWPGRDGSLTFEQRDPAGQLRAGHISATGKITITPHRTDPKLPDLHPHLAGELVVHRYGRRAVVLGRDRVHKLLRAGRASGPAGAAHQVGHVCRRAGLACPALLAATSSHLEFTRLPGQSLHALGPAGLPGWERFADTWPQVTAARLPLGSFTGADEAAVLRRWLDMVVAHQALPDLPHLTRAVEQVCAELAQPAEPLVLSHRDLHDKQFLWSGSSLAVLDLDTAAYAEPSLDLGNLLTHLELRALQGVWSAEVAAAVADRLQALTSRLPISPPRLALYRRSAALRLACVYAFRPTSASWLPAWLATHLSPSLASPQKEN
ncbi:phosphotransferase [Buchananella hordeovulneris]|uniref:phosphotransferase n=1 Tax=Buchananella hordeovulneris TaxID=52770 RepID=UPI000F5FD56C|nr:phosphotransferase [Buchananella hordeovulneris]MDO5081588.1 phosphotransferase [Buchananella hordeovulneris]RRD43780.1 serine kinase [Buchananella hordeovulneris]RRD50049.1 serine kinase [Buchananella hordeovulneris]